MTAVWVGAPVAALVVLIAVVVGRGIRRRDEDAGITRERQDELEQRYLDEWRARQW